MNFRRNVGGKLLRSGYTSGSCAAAAAKAAAITLLSGTPSGYISINTPGGIAIELPVLDSLLNEHYASCAIRKDAGDDPDVTDGVLIYAQVEKQAVGIIIEGGLGIGRVTKPGLDQPIGNAAINSVPRQMIRAALEDAAQEYNYRGGFKVIIWVPEGEKLAARTFNPRLGIEGGISIIGTTGIVEPRSHQAMIDTTRLELQQLKATGSKRVLFTPGNNGKLFANESLNLSLEEHIICSNWMGEAIKAAVELGFENILLIGHIGKLVKLGIGITNTHSSQGDGRLETLLACALEAGATLPLLQAILSCVTTDAALVLIKEANLLNETMRVLGQRINACLIRQVPASVTIGFVCFTNTPALSAILTVSDNAAELMDIWRLT